MVQKLPYVYLKRGAFYVRLVVPKPLRPFVEGSKGEILRPLGNSPKEVKANHARALASAQDELDDARRKKAIAEGVEIARETRRYLPKSVDEIAAVHYREELAFDLAERRESDRTIVTDMSWSRPARLASLARVAAGIAGNEETAAIVGWAIDEFRRRGNHKIEPATGEWRSLAMTLARAELEVAARIEERDAGVYEGRPKMRALQDDEPDPSPAVTFDMIIDEEVRRRTAGKDPKGVRAHTIKQFRRGASSFAKHRGSENAVTVTHAEGEAWIAHLQEEAVLSNKTIGVTLVDLKTVLNWGKRQHPTLFLAMNALAAIQKPQIAPVAPDERTFTMEEARTILRAAQQETNATLRFVPWMTAYSGTRISEIANLLREDFFQIGADWFIKITPAGGRTVKTTSSIRRVPVHRDLIAHGLIEHLEATPIGQRLFNRHAQPRISEWMRDRVKLRRQYMAPNHSWRHLFEDLCTLGGVPDDARSYITGRSTRSSRDRYGRSDVALPGLAREMAKVPSILETTEDDSENNPTS